MRCQDCDGTGEYRREDMTIDGIFYPACVHDCATCEGTGYVCYDCGHAPDLCECMEQRT